MGSPHWIRSGILYVKDLPFKNVFLHCESIYNIVEDKQNLFIEIQIVCDALRPYKQYILNKNIQIFKRPAMIEFAKLKSIYELLIKQKT